MKKNKIIFISALLLLGLLAVGTKIILAQTNPRVSKACEGPLGVLLSKDNGDGFNRIKTCPRGMREVVLGEEKIGDGGSETTVPNVLFISGGLFLMKNGKALYYDAGSSTWVEETGRTIPEELATRVIKWNNEFFVTKTGEIYRYTNTEPKYELVVIPTL